MTYYVGRKPDGTIYGLWTVKQSEGQESLPADHAEVVAFFAQMKLLSPKRVLPDGTIG